MESWPTCTACKGINNDDDPIPDTTPEHAVFHADAGAVLFPGGLRPDDRSPAGGSDVAGRRAQLQCHACPAPESGHYLDPVRLYRSDEHTSELQSLMRISNAVFCLKKK